MSDRDMTMKKIALFASVVSSALLQAATISQVIVRQQWPWSTDIKVEYMLTGVTSPVDVAVKAYNGGKELDSPNLQNAIRGERFGIAEGGVKTLVIDPVAAFGTATDSIPDFSVELSVTESAGNIGEVLYKIFDLSNGECEDVTRAQLLNGEKGTVETDYGKIGDGYRTSLGDVVIWTGVTNNPAYKTTHLVMRKIPAKDVVWQIGSPTDEPGRAVRDSESQKYVKLSQDYYIGVFEFTQAQFESVCGQNTTYTPVFPLDAAVDKREYPVNNISYSAIRGNMTYTGESGEKINWPTNSELHEVVADPARVCFLRDLRARCKGVEFDLPFDPQWEFACRAGVYNKGLSDGLGLRSGAEASDRLDVLGWYSANSEVQAHLVGQKRPNAFGLYDMHGNVRELLANWAGNVSNPTCGSGNNADDAMVDPLGPVQSSGARSTRGGSFDFISGYCRSASRFAATDYYSVCSNQGFRVVCPVGTKWVE